MKKVFYSLLVLVFFNLALAGCWEEFTEMLPGVYFMGSEEEFYETEDGYDFSSSDYYTVEYAKDNTLEGYLLTKMVFNEDSDNPVTYFLEFWITGTWKIEGDKLIEKYDNVYWSRVYNVDNEDSDFYKINSFVNEYCDEMADNLLEDEQGKIISLDNDVLKLEYDVDGNKEEIKLFKL